MEMYANYFKSLKGRSKTKIDLFKLIKSYNKTKIDSPQLKEDCIKGLLIPLSIFIKHLYII